MQQALSASLYALSQMNAVYHSDQELRYVQLQEDFDGHGPRPASEPDISYGPRGHPTEDTDFNEGLEPISKPGNTHGRGELSWLFSKLGSRGLVVHFSFFLLSLNRWCGPSLWPLPWASSQLLAPSASM